MKLVSGALSLVKFVLDPGLLGVPFSSVEPPAAAPPPPLRRVNPPVDVDAILYFASLGCSRRECRSVGWNGWRWTRWGLLVALGGRSRGVFSVVVGEMQCNVVGEALFNREQPPESVCDELYFFADDVVEWWMLALGRGEPSCCKGTLFAVTGDSAQSNEAGPGRECGTVRRLERRKRNDSFANTDSRRPISKMAKECSKGQRRMFLLSL